MKPRVLIAPQPRSKEIESVLRARSSPRRRTIWCSRSRTQQKTEGPKPAGHPTPAAPPARRVPSRTPAKVIAGLLCGRKGAEGDRARAGFGYDAWWDLNAATEHGGPAVCFGPRPT